MALMLPILEDWLRQRVGLIEVAEPDEEMVQEVERWCEEGLDGE